jgi:hypothetical protein
MRYMRSLSLASLAMISLIAWPTSVFACRCVEPSPTEAYRVAYAIVDAKVVQVIPGPQPPGSVAVLEVKHAWKNGVRPLIAAVTATDCSYDWKEGKRYVLFLFDNPPILYSTGRCAGNLIDERAESLRAWLAQHGAMAALLP